MHAGADDANQGDVRGKEKEVDVDLGDVVKKNRQNEIDQTAKANDQNPEEGSFTRDSILSVRVLSNSCRWRRWSPIGDGVQDGARGHGHRVQINSTNVVTYKKRGRGNLEAGAFSDLFSCKKSNESL